LKVESGQLEADKSTALDLARLTSDPATAEAKKAEAQQLDQRISVLKDKIEAVDKDLKTRAEKFRDQVRQHLGNKLLNDGEQILSAAQVPVRVVAVGLSTKPLSYQVEYLLDALRLIRSDLLDLRLARRADGGYFLDLALSGETGDDTKLIQEITSRAEPQLAALIKTDVAPQVVRQATGLTMDLLVVEDPLVRHLSPLSRALNVCRRWFKAHVPGPEQRLSAIGRNLRQTASKETLQKAGGASFANVRMVPGDDYAIRVLVVPPLESSNGTTPPATAPVQDSKNTNLATATPEEGAIQARLGALLPADSIPAATALYQRTLSAGADQRVTVCRPVLTSTFLTQKYDYMCGYFWMLAMQFIGLAIVIGFVRKVQRGEIRRRGVEEAEAAQ